MRKSPDATQSGLLSPSEWQVLVAVQRAHGPANLTQIHLGTAPSIPLGVLRALLDRLHERGFIAHELEDVWGPLLLDFETLYRAQVEHFLDTFVGTDPLGLALVGEALDVRSSRPKT